MKSQSNETDTEIHYYLYPSDQTAVYDLYFNLPFVTEETAYSVLKSFQWTARGNQKADSHYRNEQWHYTIQLPAGWNSIVVDQKEKHTSFSYVSPSGIRAHLFAVERMKDREWEEVPYRDWFKLDAKDEDIYFYSLPLDHPFEDMESDEYKTYAEMTAMIPAIAESIQFYDPEDPKENTLKSERTLIKRSENIKIYEITNEREGDLSIHGMAWTAIGKVYIEVKEGDKVLFQEEVVLEETDAAWSVFQTKVSLPQPAPGKGAILHIYSLHYGGEKDAQPKEGMEFPLSF